MEAPLKRSRTRMEIMAIIVDVAPGQSEGASLFNFAFRMPVFCHRPGLQ